MTFLLYRERETPERIDQSIIEKHHNECFLEVVGIVSDVESLWKAREKLGLYFSIPASNDERYILLVEEFKRLAYKKSNKHKTRYFLRELSEVTEEIIRFPQKKIG